MSPIGLRQTPAEDAVGGTVLGYLDGRRQPKIRPPRKLTAPTTQLKARMLFWLPGPPLLANSIPKSGTHVLSRLLSLYPRVVHSGYHIRRRDVAGPSGGTDLKKVDGALAKIGNGHFATSHFPASDALRELLEARNFRVLFMVRDPRDMLVSYVFYVLKREQHFLHDRLVNGYANDAARLTAIIQGMPSDTAVESVPSARQRLDAYIGWLEANFVYTCRFEDLIGERGGGCADRQLRAIYEIGDFINRPVTERTAAHIADLVWNPGSITFRKGVIGDWRSHFTDEHRTLMKEIAGDYLIRLGYERDNDW